jgi:hypothetical protein
VDDEHRQPDREGRLPGIPVACERISALEGAKVPQSIALPTSFVEYPNIKSGNDFYPALARPNVSVETSEISRITRNVIPMLHQ